MSYARNPMFSIPAVATQYQPSPVLERSMYVFTMYILSEAIPIFKQKKHRLKQKKTTFGFE